MTAHGLVLHIHVDARTEPAWFGSFRSNRPVLLRPRIYFFSKRSTEDRAMNGGLLSVVRGEMSLGHVLRQIEVEALLFS